ncbi:MAG: glycine zipper family protein [Nitrospirales bacterium]
MKKRIKWKMVVGRAWLSSICFVLFLSGCSGSTPVLYPNDLLQAVGEEQMEQDLEVCEELAEQYIETENAGGKVAGQTVTGGAIGAATGAVGGAITGNLGLGTAIGAAAGATQGLLRGIFTSGGDDSSPVYRKFIDRCLREKGYEPIGWN